MTVDTLMPIIFGFMAGLFGGTHCVVMCGGIVSVFSANIKNQSKYQQALILLFYNLGRISSYMLAGAIMGGLGSLLIEWLPLKIMRFSLTLMAGIFMILLGFYLTRWWQGLVFIERLGKGLWQYIQPLARRFTSIQNPIQAFIGGMLWGWLPCGLVYAVLISAVASTSPLQGALILFAFGLGTLPTLLLMGVFIGGIAHLIQQSQIRIVAGLIMIGFGISTLFRLSI